jgi:hypothetical protein
LIHDIDLDAEMDAGREQKPLPVPVVRRQQHDRLPALDAALHEFGVLHRDAPPDGGRAGAETPERLHKRIGEIAIGPANDLRPLACAPVGKRVGDIALAIVASPAHHVIGDEIDERAPRIKEPQRYAGQQSEEELHAMEATRNGIDYSKTLARAFRSATTATHFIRCRKNPR